MNNTVPTYGYVGKIARLNLSNCSVEIIPTSKYVPEYIGGRSVCNKIFWDQVPPGTGAFDPENKISMTGPTTATGIPTGGRCVFTGISPNSFLSSMPERHRRLVRCGVETAGYDGFIVEGRAPEPTYTH